MKRRQKRKIVILSVLVALLALGGLWYWNFARTRSLTIDIVAPPQAALTAPRYLFSFAGTAANHLQSPIGVLADGGFVYVADSTSGRIFVFRQTDGSFVRTFGKGQLSDPIYIAKDPKDGLLYVTDRGKSAILKFTTAGVFTGEFDPKLPKAEQPPALTHGSMWTPIALGFAPDGTMFVTDILKDQRMLIFAPDGTFTRSVGTQGVASTAADLPGKFQFPNSVKVLGNEVWVVDSNNRRIEIFGLDGTYKRLVPLAGLPRGMVFLPKTSAVSSGTTDVFAVVDVLASEVTLYATSDVPSVSLGSKGSGDGQFNLPNDITVGDSSVLFVTDNMNGRVEAWGWSANLSPIPRVLPQQPAWCLLALPLLLLPLLFRKKKYYATADFVRAMASAGALAELRQPRTAWLVSEGDYDSLTSDGEDGAILRDVLRGSEYSDTDARALAERYSMTMEQAATLVSARQAKLFLTEDPGLRKLARLLEIDTMDAEEFRARTQRPVK